MILISGASCTGKTTTATTLLHSLRIPAVFWPRESVRVAVAAGSASDLADLEHRLFESYVDALVGYARRGLIAIGETIIMNDVDWSAVQHAQRATPIVIVRLFARFQSWHSGSSSAGRHTRAPPWTPSPASSAARATT